MRNNPFLFLFGFAMGYLPVLLVLAKINVAAPETLAQDSPRELTVVLETQAPVIEEKHVSAAVETPELTPRSVDMNVASPTPSPILIETPTPIPTPTPDVWAPPELEGWFTQYAGSYGIDKNILERLANCESHFNVNSQNKDYLGMFQFSSSTWSNYRVQMGLDPNPALRTNAEESIKTAAFVIQQRGVAPWPSCLR